MELLIFICVGVFTGLSAGLLGVGGGIISVPAMVLLLPYFNVPSHLIMHIAIATSLALIIPTSVISAYSHHQKNAIVWSYIKKLMPGLILGSVVGASVVVSLDRGLLQAIFASFLMLIALYMIFSKQPNSSRSTSSIKAVTYFVVSSMIGFISSLMGVGGGTMTVPYLVWHGIALPNAIGSSAFCGLPIAIAGTVTFFMLSPNSGIGAVSLIYLPAFIGILFGVMIFTSVGAKLAHQLNVDLLKRIFVAMLILVSLKLFIS